MQHAMNVGLFVNCLNQILQRHNQAFGPEFRRKKTSGKITGEIDSFFKAVYKFLCIARFGTASRSEFFLQNLSDESCTSEMLPKLIVEVMTKAAAFAIRHLRDLLVESSPFNHLALVRCRPFVDTSIELPNENS
jgi:hypothetical protein